MKIIGKCPFDCSNKTAFGWCRTTLCINPLHSNIGTAGYGQGAELNIVTNADRIRAMTDEEIVASFCNHCKNTPDEVCETLNGCDECLQAWLKQEAEE